MGCSDDGMQNRHRAEEMVAVGVRLETPLRAYHTSVGEFPPPASGHRHR